jgi:hypothetical protein
MKMTRLSTRFYVAVLVLSLVLLGIQMGCVGVNRQVQSEPSIAEDTLTEFLHYLPLVYRSADPPPLELVAAETRNDDGQVQNFFFLWDSVGYTASGMNNQGEAIQATLSWTLDGPCEPGEFYRDTVTLPPGPWEHTYQVTTPGCNGAFTSTVEIDHLGATHTLSSTYLVNLEQAFDRCSLPTVSQMQAWWDSSPYTVWNIYLGGIHFPCSLTNLTPSWVQSVSQQGWDFILTWVGPQAPCSDFYYRFSSNWVTAYFQGGDEADAALAKARSLGIDGDLVIYYDLEAYIVPDGDTTCRYAAAKFIQGWTERLHSQGVLGGGYGSPCNSYIKDWYSYNATAPDDVWIAHWLLPAQYRPDASVWNVACMDNTYWPDHQRIRQYAGDHVETWGGVAFTIDSSVVDGDTVTIPAALNASISDLDRPVGSLISQEGEALDAAAEIYKVDLVSPRVGWALSATGLLRTDDGGRQWRDVALETSGGGILEAAFLDGEVGWAVVRSGTPDAASIQVLRTSNGGESWEAASLPGFHRGIAAASLHFLDPDTGWLVLKWQSGSSFSRGDLYATQDGGLTWEKRSAPLGEPVVFVDPGRGWMVGGPTGDGFYRTLDGGLTWEPQQLPGLPDGSVYLGQPQFTTPRDGLLPVTLLAEPLARLLIFASDDGGDTWVLDREVALAPGSQPGGPVPFDRLADTWRVSDPAAAGLMVFEEREDTGASIAQDAAGLPAGTVQLDFVSAEHGWALVQDNRCNGDKIPGDQPDSEPLTCWKDTRLFWTEDGGLNWLEVSPSAQ